MISMVMYSCTSLTTTLDVDDSGFFTESLVIGSIVAAGDSVLRMHVGTNRSFLDDGDFSELNLPDAEIEVTKETTGETIAFDELDQNLNTAGENYRKIIDADFFEPGSYTFKIEHPDFPVSETTVEMPQTVAVRNFSFEFEGGLDQDGDDVSEVVFEILDDPGVRQFYEVQVLVDDQVVFIRSIDPVTLESFERRTLLLDDETFDGQAKRLEVNFKRWNWNPDFSENITIRLLSVNEGYYLLSKSARRQLDSQNNPFATAVQINSNVNNALGVIGLSASASETFTP